MMFRITIFSLAVTAMTFSAAVGSESVSQSSSLTEQLGGRKTVTVYADSEAAAFSEANRKNPGWSAISAKKTGGGKAYQVTMTKD
jgi:hypothetical protein